MSPVILINNFVIPGPRPANPAPANPAPANPAPAKKKAKKSGKNPGRPKKVDKICYSIEKYCKEVQGDHNVNDNMLDNLMEVINEDIKNMNMK